MTNRKLLTEGELRRLKNGSQVHVVCTGPERYEGPMSVHQIDGAVALEVFLEDRAISLEYELTGDDTVAADSFSGDGDSIKIYSGGGHEMAS